MTSPASDPDEPAWLCRMCVQCGHMIRAAENRDERALAQVLRDVLAEHRARHRTGRTSRFRNGETE